MVSYREVCIVKLRPSICPRQPEVKPEGEEPVHTAPTHVSTTSGDRNHAANAPPTHRPSRTRAKLRVNLGVGCSFPGSFFSQKRKKNGSLQTASISLKTYRGSVSYWVRHALRPWKKAALTQRDRACALTRAETPRVTHPMRP